MDKRDKFKLEGNTIAGTFRVDEVVAEGGFGVVYRAFHLHFRSPVALKCLKIPGELSEDERKEFLEQFRSEAEIQFRLSAALPNIVRPLHVDAVHSDRGEFIPLMALEWLDGLSFETIIEQRTFSDQPPMPLSEAVELIGPAAHALHQAHNFDTGEEKLSVIHRDIKPDNLFLTEVRGRRAVKLLDFGISKVRRAATQLAGHFSQTAGTAPFSPAYGAPEQWLPKRFGQTGPWTDVWGLALTLVEIIKGDAVIVGDHQAMMGTALDPKVRPSPRSEGVNVNDDVESVFLKALSLDPRYRYQSIEAFWEALQAAIQLSDRPAYAETPSGSRIALPPMSAPTPWKSPAEPAKPEKVGSLPPMLAPAPMKPTTEADLEVQDAEEASYPTNPHSDLHPVPAAPTSWSYFNPEVPPADEAHHPPAPVFDHDEFVDASSVNLELASTSDYPEHDSLDLELVNSPSGAQPADAPSAVAPSSPVVNAPRDGASEPSKEAEQERPVFRSRPAPKKPPRPAGAAPRVPQKKPPVELRAKAKRPPRRVVAQPTPPDAFIPDLAPPRSQKPPPAPKRPAKQPPPPKQGRLPEPSAKKAPPPPPRRSKQPPPLESDARPAKDTNEEGDASDHCVVPGRGKRSMG